MSKVLTVERAIELENHFIIASQALKCAYINMRGLNGFEATRKEISAASIDAATAAIIMRRWIDEKG